MAPEVLKGNCGVQSDIWSLGVLVYQMVTGTLPFDDSDGLGKLIKAIKVGKYKALPEQCSKNFKDLIKKMLNTDPRKRITAQEALAHPWLKQFKSRE
jgi:calcium-dependent protein kinase